MSVDLSELTDDEVELPSMAMDYEQKYNQTLIID